jgi:hypothetical protein
LINIFSTSKVGNQARVSADDVGGACGKSFGRVRGPREMGTNEELRIDQGLWKDSARTIQLNLEMQSKIWTYIPFQKKLDM